MGILKRDLAHWVPSTDSVRTRVQELQLCFWHKTAKLLSTIFSVSRQAQESSRQASAKKTHVLGFLKLPRGRNRTATWSIQVSTRCWSAMIRGAWVATRRVRRGSRQRRASASPTPSRSESSDEAEPKRQGQKRKEGKREPAMNACQRMF